MRNRQHNYKKEWGGFWESVFILLEVIDVIRAITLLYFICQIADKSNTVFTIHNTLYSIYITQYAICSTAYYL